MARHDYIIFRVDDVYSCASPASSSIYTLVRSSTYRGLAPAVHIPPCPFGQGKGLDKTQDCCLWRMLLRVHRIRGALVLRRLLMRMRHLRTILGKRSSAGKLWCNAENRFRSPHRPFLHILLGKRSSAGKFCCNAGSRFRRRHGPFTAQART
jgi:hypothetical protein